MPFTPFHWGISLLIQSIFIFLNPLALFLGSVISDIEGVISLYIFPSAELPIHSFLHSIIGGIIIAFIVGLISWVSFSRVLTDFDKKCKLKYFFKKYSLRNSILSSLLGTQSHIILDAFLYNEMNLFYPISYGNPLYGIAQEKMIYLICIISFIAGSIILILRFSNFYLKRQK